MSDFDNAISVIVKAHTDATQFEFDRIIKDLRLMNLICHGDNPCKMCERTGTNPWVRGCVMNPIVNIIKGK